MKKIDWYILKKFLSTFFFAIFLFTIIAVVVDISEKTDDFVASGLSAKQILMQYYIGFIPHIIALLFPLFVFIAVIFFTSKMALRSEIIAIMASGTSYRRWLRPYWVGGVFLALLLWYANHYVVPRANKIRGAFEAQYVDKNSNYENLTKSVNNPGSDVYFRVDSFTYAGVYNYDTLSKRGGPFFMDSVRNGRLVSNTRAESFFWDTSVKKWKLSNVLVRRFFPLKEKLKMLPNLSLRFNFVPSDLMRDKYTKDKLTSPELSRFIRLEKQHGVEGLNELIVENNRRDATCVSVILLTMIGGIVAGRKVRGGSGAHLAIGFVTAALFIVLDRFSTVFSTKGNLPPAMAAWIPNLLFFFVAFWIYKRAPK